MAKFSANPGLEHWKAVKRILPYRHGTRDLGLVFHTISPGQEEHYPCTINSMIPIGYVDADYARDPSTRRSCTGYIFFLAEFGCLFAVPLAIFEDNKACVDYTKNSTNHQRTKHISVRYHFIRDLVTTGILQLVPIPSAENIADIFTKPLDKRVFQFLRAKFMHVL